MRAQAAPFAGSSRAPLRWGPARGKYSTRQQLVVTAAEDDGVRRRGGDELRRRTGGSRANSPKGRSYETNNRRRGR